MTSSNGINWTLRTAAAANEWFSIVWSAELSIFVAVSRTGTGNRVMTSPDGINWTTRSSEDSDWYSVTWSPELYLFVAVANGGTNQVMTSSDGITWTARSVLSAGWQKVIWAPEISIFMAVSTSDVIITSHDGILWRSRSVLPTGGIHRTLAWSPEISAFIIAAASGLGDRVRISNFGLPNSKNILQVSQAYLTTTNNNIRFTGSLTTGSLIATTIQRHCLWVISVQGTLVLVQLVQRRCL
jgi:hypothetical protein